MIAVSIWLLLPYCGNDGRCSFSVSTAPPSFTATPPQYVEAKEGGSTLLSCSAQGNPKPMISWLRDGEELATNAKYSVRENNGRDSDLWLCTKIEARFVHRWCHPVSPSVQRVCDGLGLTQYRFIMLLWCRNIPFFCDEISVDGSNTYFRLKNVWCWDFSWW